MKRILICIVSLAIILSCEKEKQIVINEGSISGSWEIASMAWEEIEGGKITSSEDIKHDDTTIIIDINTNGTISSKATDVETGSEARLSEGTWSLSNNKLTITETFPEEGLTYDCEIKNLTNNTMDIIEYLYMEDDYAETRRLSCKRR